MNPSDIFIRMRDEESLICLDADLAELAERCSAARQRLAERQP